MKIAFFKYQGTGNDFIIIDDRNSIFPVDNQYIISLCDRRFGIGSDGLILIQKSDTADFHMEFYNPDASKSFCGNGSRCAVAFAHRIGIIDKTAHFTAIDGDHKATIDADELVEVSMKDVEGIRKIKDDFVLNTGSPHYIRFTQDLSKENIIETGREIRYSDEFKSEGINVNMVEIENDNSLSCVTYERGVEDETLSCGTGVTAIAIAANMHSNLEAPISVITKGGKLEVRFKTKDDSYVEVFLKGPANFVYKGEI